MATEALPERVNVGDYAGKRFLLDLERAEFYKLLDEAPWEGTTASGHWQVRDLCGHMIDVTQGYLKRWEMARSGSEAPAPLGLKSMAQKLDENATAFRALSKADAIHSWDIKAGLGRDEPLSDAAAVTLIPFMLIVIQYTGTVAGDAALGERIRDLLFKI